MDYLSESFYFCKSGLCYIPAEKLHDSFLPNKATASGDCPEHTGPVYDTLAAAHFIPGYAVAVKVRLTISKASIAVSGLSLNADFSSLCLMPSGYKAGITAEDEPVGDFSCKPASSGDFACEELSGRVFRQLREYFLGMRETFELPLSLTGTPFQIKIWETASKIPYGNTVSYGSLAFLAGFSGAARATGQALKRNPVAILIPCHRIIASDKRLCGFYGGIDLKALLLSLENCRDFTY